jgi:hypothetical protein
MDLESIKQQWHESRYSQLDYEQVEWLLARVEELEPKVASAPEVK